jgi:tRNA A37 methylthiotransferase MiaB
LAGFAKVHVFSYSPRTGTPAAELPGRIPPAAVAERRDRLRVIERELTAAYHRSLLGRTLDVLVESADPRRPGFVRGTSCRSVTVAFRGHLPALIRRRVPVRAVVTSGDALVGEPVSEANAAGDAGSGRIGRLALAVL